ncbi:MAG: serine/threonine-protein kinase [Deltaproteobacteria bacterium]|nr:serine/threonine-protein kinase [Deltaproteobacteria bacterium]
MEIGKYTVVRKLGEGGMGTVWLGRAPPGDERGDELVVLKIPLHPTPKTTTSLEDEARTGFRLQHPHIVRTIDFFIHQNKPVLVIEFIDGASLRDLRDSAGQLPPAMVARVGEQVSDALATIHHLKDEDGRPLQILHRDVTPGNILVDRQGNAKLIDLGIARSVETTAQKTAHGVLKGTFRYLSPDLFAGKNYSWMTDLWALGITLFECAIGRRAVTGTDHVVLGAILKGEVTTLRDGEALHPMLRFLFDGLLVVDEQQRRFRDPKEVLHAFRVIRARLGDGADEAIAVMQAQPQGDVSGEFGSEQGVPTVEAEQVAEEATAQFRGRKPSVSPDFRTIETPRHLAGPDLSDLPTETPDQAPVETPVDDKTRTQRLGSLPTPHMTPPPPPTSASATLPLTPRFELPVEPELE